MRDIKKDMKNLLNILTIVVGIIVIITATIRFFYIDHMSVTLVNISTVLAMGLITSSLYRIGCELPTLINEQWYTKKVKKG